jgi:hypothetical protein
LLEGEMHSLFCGYKNSFMKKKKKGFIYITKPSIIMMAKFITAGNRSMREAQVRFWQEHYTTMAGLYLLGQKPLGKEKFSYLWFS